MTYPLMLVATGFILWLISFVGLLVYGMTLISERKHLHGTISIIAGTIIMAVGYMVMVRFG